MFVGLNPSTADHKDDDPTIRRVIGFSKDLGFERLMVGNVFALRSVDPSALKTHDAPVGPDNYRHLAEMANRGRRDLLEDLLTGSVTDADEISARAAHLDARGGA